MTGPALPSFFRLLRFGQLASTNEEAARLAAEGAAEGTLIVADKQSAGHGRRGRLWVSPPGNLYCSLVLRPPSAPREAAQIGFAASLAVLQSCRDLAPGASFACKWPNDVLANGRKLAGILLESRAAGGAALSWLVLGIGINLVSYPPDTEFPATSLAEAGAPGVSPDRMLPILAARFLVQYETWRRPGGFASLRADWLAHAQGMGKAIRVRLADREIDGRFSGLDAEGRLLLDGAEGRQAIAAAEIFPAA
ncbi:MAG TPA: biotin--[acetyl-CoA-carboxylase] ligase [Stellaceae bacterium]|nr:biotin--[acetyl-CoA-carboxylase] ligase [Stellaceae bacterium]